MRTRDRNGHLGSTVTITTAGPSLGADQRRRAHVYLIQMSIRLACFLGAVLAAGGWLTWTLIAAAVVLPYSAVLLANAGRHRGPGTDPLMKPRELDPPTESTENP